MKPNSPIIYASLIVLAGGFLLSGCNLQNVASPTPTEIEIPALEQATPTPTIAPIRVEPQAPTEEPTLPPPTGGEIELRFTDTLTQKECIAHFPFAIVEEAGQRKIDGSGVLDCQQEIQQCGEGVCITYHSQHTMEAVIRGFIRGATADFPDGFLEANAAGTYTLTQYWSDYPPETVVVFTEDHPSVISGSDIIPLNFNFADGATAEVQTQADALPWVFTLHLK